MTASLAILDWTALDEAQRAAVLRRPAQREAASLLEGAGRIVRDVRERGDEALREYTERLDRVRLESFAVGSAEFAAAEAALTAEQHAALRRAIETVTLFHERQRVAPLSVETSPGVTCERMIVPLNAVGLYVPAGTAPLPSTATSARARWARSGHAPAASRQASAPPASPGAACTASACRPDMMSTTPS